MADIVSFVFCFGIGSGIVQDSLTLSIEKKYKFQHPTPTQNLGQLQPISSQKMSTLHSSTETSAKSWNSQLALDEHLLAGQNEAHVVAACDDSEHEQDNSAAVLDDVCLAFGTQEVLHRVSVSFRKGTTTAIVGPNGSGKTSLLRIVAGFTHPTVGTICWHDVANIAMAEQTISADFWMPLRVKDVLVMGRYVTTGAFKRLSKQDRHTIAEAARRMDVGDLLSRQIGELSGGQKRRVRLAMCLAQQADLLLLDEPESGLDITSQQRLFAEIDKERQRGAAVVFTTHTLSEAARSDQVLLLNHGTVVHGAASEVLQDDNLNKAFGLANTSGDANHPCGNCIFGKLNHLEPKLFDKQGQKPQWRS